MLFRARRTLVVLLEKVRAVRKVWDSDGMMSVVCAQAINAPNDLKDVQSGRCDDTNTKIVKLERKRAQS
jgi:hypothetical protein